MKILVISDIHANIDALNTVLEKENDYDILCCAGDYTDYGIYPVEVINKMCNLKNNAVLVYGNHDLHVLNTYETREWKHVEAGQYKWVHYNCEQLSMKEITWIKQLQRTGYFEADGWQYGIQHQYDNGYGTIESRHAFEEYWEKNYPSADSKKRRLIFGHTHRQCVHILGDGMEWLNPGSISYRRPDDPDKTAHYAVIVDGNIQLKQLPYDRSRQLKKAKEFMQSDKMMRTEIQDFMFFFGNAKTSREPLNENGGRTEDEL